MRRANSHGPMDSRDEELTGPPEPSAIDGPSLSFASDRSPLAAHLRLQRSSFLQSTAAFYEELTQRYELPARVQAELDREIRDLHALPSPCATDETDHDGAREAAVRRDSAKRVARVLMESAASSLRARFERFPFRTDAAIRSWVAGALAFDASTKGAARLESIVAALELQLPASAEQLLESLRSDQRRLSKRLQDLEAFIAIGDRSATTQALELLDQSSKTSVAAQLQLELALKSLLECAD